MVSLRELDGAGDLWRTGRLLASSLDTDIVIPRPFIDGPNALGAHRSVTRRDGITILGVAISVVHTGTGWVRLNSSDPAFGSSGTIDDPVHEFHFTGTASSQQVVDDCVWCISPANYIATPTTGATLQLQSSTNITVGWITVWGIHGQLDIGGRRSYTSSPADYSVGFAD